MPTEVTRTFTIWWSCTKLNATQATNVNLDGSSPTSPTITRRQGLRPNLGWNGWGNHVSRSFITLKCTLPKAHFQNGLGPSGYIYIYASETTSQYSVHGWSESEVLQTVLSHWRSHMLCCAVRKCTQTQMSAVERRTISEDLKEPNCYMYYVWNIFP